MRSTQKLKPPVLGSETDESLHLGSGCPKVQATLNAAHADSHATFPLLLSRESAAPLTFAPARLGTVASPPLFGFLLLLTRTFGCYRSSACVWVPSPCSAAFCCLKGCCSAAPLLLSAAFCCFVGGLQLLGSGSIAVESPPIPHQLNSHKLKATN